MTPMLTFMICIRWEGVPSSNPGQGTDYRDNICVPKVTPSKSLDSNFNFHSCFLHIPYY
jgi:hypothetical protein